MSEYQQQFDRVLRYYDRFQKLNGGIVMDRPSEEYIDDVYAFFQACYHLKDHLKNDPNFTKKTNQDIENYITSNSALALCADICNASKHLTLSQPPRSGGLPLFKRRSFETHVGHNLSGEDPPQITAIKLEVEHNGQPLDAFTIATDAVNAWKSFV